MREYFCPISEYYSFIVILTHGLDESEPEDVDLVGLWLRDEVGEDEGVLLDGVDAGEVGAAVHAAARAGRVVEGLAGARVLAAHQQVAVAVPLGPSCGNVCMFP